MAHQQGVGQIPQREGALAEDLQVVVRLDSHGDLSAVRVDLVDQRREARPEPSRLGEFSGHPALDLCEAPVAIVEDHGLTHCSGEVRVGQEGLRVAEGGQVDTFDIEEVPFAYDMRRSRLGVRVDDEADVDVRQLDGIATRH